jgi:hypothetical protein
MRLKCDKCDITIKDADTATAINMMGEHYATHKGATPKGTKQTKVKDVETS